VSDPAIDQNGADLVRVLVICRANVCRSPIAARMLKARLQERGAGVVVDSAGLSVEEPGPNESLVRSAAEWNLDLSDHRPRVLAVDDTRSASLIVTMEHHQVSEVVMLDPDAWPRTFTLREAVRRADTTGSRSNQESFAEWVARLHYGRSRLGLVGAWHDDVSDPAGQPSSELERTVGELDVLTSRLTDAAWPRTRIRTLTKGRRRR
jgi:protein-tyrosine phosphatase